MAAKAPELHVLIMAGGSGTRFWPKSRSHQPKQLLALWDDKTLLEHTVARMAKASQPISSANIWIVTTRKLVEASRRILQEHYPDLHYLGEPEGKNTAACILWGTHEISKVYPDAIVAVVPADHFIGNEDAFLSALDIAVQKAAQSDGLVTLGVRPSRPETGYGYIEFEKGATDASESRPVARFVEKPGIREAVRYIESGHYLWNAGMFVFSARAGLNAFSRTMPRLASLFEGALHVDKIYSEIKPEDAVSVDYGVMEQAIAKGIPVSVVPVACEWNDVGSFTALEEIDRAVRGQMVSLDSNSNVVQSDRGLVALLGVNDLVVVRDGDVVLVAAKDRAQDVKRLLEKVKASHPEAL